MILYTAINDDGKVIMLKTMTSTTEDIVIIDGHDGTIVQKVQNMVRLCVYA
jgi:hypothetical protein